MFYVCLCICTIVFVGCILCEDIRQNGYNSGAGALFWCYIHIYMYIFCCRLLGAVVVSVSAVTVGASLLLNSTIKDKRQQIHFCNLVMQNNFT